MNTIGVTLGVAAFFVAGMIAILIPNRLREAAMRAKRNSPSVLMPLYFPGYLSSKYFVPVARAIGILSISIAVTVAIMFLVR